jgi:O-acetyl-ADP-ribose deacetylase (regulator of RNase III)
MGVSIQLVKGDITSLDVDAVVNAANSALAGGGGVDGAIHRAAGPRLDAECAAIRAARGGCAPGDAVATSGCGLRARYVIHAVGPVWRGGGRGEAALLRGCYERSLRLAEELSLASIAFPNIATGVYGFPKDLAADIVVGCLREAGGSLSSVREIFLVCFDEENYRLYADRLGA